MRSRLRVMAALAAASIAAACNGSGGPGPQTQPIVVSSVSPSTGTTFGGTTVTITGQNFASGATVQFGGTPATDVTVVSETTITAKTPAQTAGAKEVKVTAGTRTGVLASAFTFVAPVTGPNTPPVIQTLLVQPPRPEQPVTMASIGDRISLTASVNDAETPAAQLTYQWTAIPNVGSFSGTGPAVQWTAPASLTSPQTVSLILTVVEKYQEAGTNGLPVQKEHSVQRSAAIKVHDTQKEVTDMALDFWKLFLTPSITNPDQVLHNFSTTCDDGAGRAAEYDDIVAHRNTVAEVLTYTLSPPSLFEYDFGSRSVCSNKGGVGDTCVQIPVFVRERLKGSTTPREVTGTGFLTAAYENAQWRLCYSLWTPAPTLTGTPVQYDVAPLRPGIIKGPKDK